MFQEFRVLLMHRQQEQEMHMEQQNLTNLMLVGALKTENLWLYNQTPNLIHPQTLSPPSHPSVRPLGASHRGGIKWQGREGEQQNGNGFSPSSIFHLAQHRGFK